MVLHFALAVLNLEVLFEIIYILILSIQSANNVLEASATAKIYNQQKINKMIMTTLD